MSRSTKPKARIENWAKVGNCLLGQIQGHTRQDEFFKPFQLTSNIVREGKGWIETENTRYILGEPA